MLNMIKSIKLIWNFFFNKNANDDGLKRRETILLTLTLCRKCRTYYKQTYYNKTSTQPPLAQSSKNTHTDTNHITPSPLLFSLCPNHSRKHTYPAVFNLVNLYPITTNKIFQSPEVRSLLIEEGSGTSLCTSLQLRIPCTHSLATLHIYSTSPILCYSSQKV